MKRSKQVPASLIIGLAAGIAGGGCGAGSSTYSECRDSMGRVVPNSYCSTGGYAGAHWVTVQRNGFGGSGGSGGSFGGGAGG